MPRPGASRVAEKDLRGSETMSSRLVRLLAAIALVAAISMDVGSARAGTMPIHRGLPSDGYGEPEGGGEIHGLALFFGIIGAARSNPPGELMRVVAEWMMARQQVTDSRLDRNERFHRSQRGPR
jgi:hypothetical protein